MMLDFSANISLENDRVRLIPLHENHFSGLRKVCEDPEIWKYLFEQGYDSQQLKRYLQIALEHKKAGQEYPFVVLEKSTHSIIGMTRIYSYSKKFRAIKIGHTWYGKTFRGTGLNKHCKYLLFEFLFEQLALERIGFGVHEENIISISALHSVGCQQEGRLRAMFPSLVKQGRADAILFSILKTDWEHHVKTTLKNKLI